jgi:HSP20 family protein
MHNKIARASAFRPGGRVGALMEDKMSTTMLVPWNWFKREEDAMPARQGRRGQYRSSQYRGPIDAWYRDMNDFFDNFFGVTPVADGKGNGRNSELAFIRPNLDVSADDKAYKVTVELPGVDDKDVKVELDKDVLRIFGEKRHESEEKDAGDNGKENGKNGKGYYRIERSYGSFERDLAVPDDVDASAITATHKDGILTVTLPRKAVVLQENKQIAINKQ